MAYFCQGYRGKSGTCSYIQYAEVSDPGYNPSMYWFRYVSSFRFRRVEKPYFLALEFQ